MEFGEFLHDDVLLPVPHHQWVFSLPKRLRPFFLYNRSLLAQLSLCAWKVLSKYLEQGVSLDNPKPAAIIAVQTFGDFLNFNPHLHVIAADGCFNNDGTFMTCVIPNADHLEPLFRREVLKLLKREGKINSAIIENMDSWHHSGFHVYCGQPIRHDDNGLERLAQYVIRAPISQERMVYLPAGQVGGGLAQVIYTGKNSRVQERFTALDWLARLVTHIPNKGEQVVRYYGYYSNKARGIRKKAESLASTSKHGSASDPSVPVILDSDMSGKAFRRNWARLIQKVYHTDPLLCPKYHGEMKIISFIEDEDTIRQILRHLGLWRTGNHDPPVQVKPSNITTGYGNILHVDFTFPLPDSTLTNGKHFIREVFFEQMPFEDAYSQVSPCED